jgi:hypothetical protein
VPRCLLGDAVALALADPSRAEGCLEAEAHQEGEDAEGEPSDDRTMGRSMGRSSCPWPTHFFGGLELTV